jgi:hypothetical protein
MKGKGLPVFTTFFGDENYMWATALANGTVLTVIDDDLFHFWRARDREGFIRYAGTNKLTRSGARPAPNVASRWFNYAENVVQSTGDIWLHYDGKDLWWTRTTAEPAVFEENGPPSPADRQIPVHVVKKPAENWSNMTAQGNRLEWRAIHKKARDFLVPQSTQAKLSPSNAEYALALIAGDDLSFWHARSDWSAKIASPQSQRPAIIFSDRQKTIAQMVYSVTRTTSMSNGQEVTRTVKNKDLNMSEPELEAYIAELLDTQEDRCALSDLPLQFLGSVEDKQMLCSLDRIDSAGHYERGNLQVVCRFINKWKSDTADEEFRRLLAVFRSGS